MKPFSRVFILVLGAATVFAATASPALASDTAHVTSATLLARGAGVSV